MTLGLRLLQAARSAYPRIATYPSSWGVTRSASNPCTSNTAGEPNEMYTPACFRASNGDVWMYVKGTKRIYAWKSTDAGVTFSLQNAGGQVVGPGSAGAWDSQFALEPTVLYDQANATIHLWYKGTNDSSGAGNWAWGHATASDSDPLTFTKDSANPILTSTTVASDLGGGPTIFDLGIGDVTLIGSTYYFYGYAGVNDRYRLIQATGSAKNNPSGVSSILTASDTTTHKVLITPSVVRVTGAGSALYVMFYSQGAAQPNARTIRAGTSRDGATWDFSNVLDILYPNTGWDSNETYAAHMLKVNTSPWADPYVDGSGNWLFYYSGLDFSSHALAGLAYFNPVWP